MSNNPMAQSPYTLSPEELRAVQLTELEMLIEADRICKKCGIKYCVIAGTALGAIRHKGFIPWDDDADLAFLRPEYEKFREACETELDWKRFYFQDHRNTAGYRWGYGKLRRKGTRFLRLNQEHMPYEQGIFIDIFPLDNVPDNYLLRSMHSFQCFLYRKAFWSKVGRRETCGLPKIMYELLYLIPERRLYSSFNKFMKKTNRKKTNMVRILTFPAANRAHGYFRKWYDELMLVEFEGVSLPAAKDYDGYLSFKFGDYMKPPKEEDKKTHPILELKLVKKI